MKLIQSWVLKNNVLMAQVDELPVELLQEQAKKFLSPEYPMLPKSYGLDAGSVEKLKTIKNRLKSQYTLRLALFQDEELIGWTDGWQDSIEQDTFFMGASLVIPSFQRSGYYSAMVQKVFEITKEAGFQSVSSLHIMTNNPVLIAKLKLGFCIYGFEVNTRYGALVRLVYHHNDIKKKALKFRAGAVKELDVIKALKD